MGLGERIRRAVERVSRFHSVRSETEYVYLKCGAEFNQDHHSCPKCGRTFVVRQDPESESD